MTVELLMLLICTISSIQCANTLSKSVWAGTVKCGATGKFCSTRLILLGRFHMLCNKLHNKRSPPQFIALWTQWVQRTIETEQCFLIVWGNVCRFALTIGAAFAKRTRATPHSPQGSTLSDTTRGFSLTAHSLHNPTSFPPSFPSVRNLYFISELWSSSAQLSADKAQEALERRHGYLDGRGKELGERKAGRQAGTQPPRGTSPSPRYFFHPSLFFSPSLTASPPLP